MSASTTARVAATVLRPAVVDGLAGVDLVTPLQIGHRPPALAGCQRARRQHHVLVDGLDGSLLAIIHGAP